MRDEAKENEGRSGTPVSDGHISDGSDGTKQTELGGIQFHEKAFLRISLNKENETVSASLTDTRFNTSFGSKQEDHVIPHRLILEVIAKKMTGSKLTEIPGILHATFSSVFPSRRWPTPSVIEHISIKPGSEDEKYLLERGFSPDIYNKGLRADRVEKVEEYVKEVFSFYNELPEVTHEKTGNKGEGEGKVVSSSLAALNAIDKFLAFKEQLRGVTPIGVEELKLQFAKNALAINGELVDGMQRIFFSDSDKRPNGKNKAISEVRQMFGLPGNVAQDHKKFNNIYENFFHAMNEKAYDGALVAGLVEKIFDFPRDQRPKDGVPQGVDEGDYIAKTEDLIEASSQCLSMVYTAFPKIHENIDEMVISSLFLDKVITNQKWDQNIMSVQPDIVFTPEIGGKDTKVGKEFRRDTSAVISSKVSAYQDAEKAEFIGYQASVQAAKESRKRRRNEPEEDQRREGRWAESVRDQGAINSSSTSSIER